MFRLAPDGLPPPGNCAIAFKDNNKSRTENNFCIKLYFNELDAL